MYTFEIDHLMRLYNYRLSSINYVKVLATSPQIIDVQYHPYGDYYEIQTNDGGDWKFKVYYRKEFST